MIVIEEIIRLVAGERPLLKANIYVESQMMRESYMTPGGKIFVDCKNGYCKYWNNCSKAEDPKDM